MAGDWIKVECSTPDKPEVVLMSSILKMDQNAVMGRLLRIWIWADGNSVAGAPLTVTEAFIDTVARRRGFAKAMREAGWLDGENGNLRFPNFTRHNGKSAKQRAMTNRRIAEYRSRNANVTPPSLQKEDNGNANVTPRSGQKRIPEKRRDRDKTPIIPFPGDDTLKNRVRMLWHKRETTPFDRSEATAWEKARPAVAATSQEQWSLLAWWFEADPAFFPDAKFRRHDLATHLNNWNAELLRAAAAAKKYGVDFGKKEERRIGFPEDWKERVEREFPECNVPGNFHQLPASMQRWVLEDARKRS